MLIFNQAMVSRRGGRPENQDCAGYADLSDQGLVCALADGLGGHRGGSTASRLAVTTVLEAVRRDLSFSPDGLIDLEQKAHEAIVAGQQEPGLEGMRSTLVLLVVWQGMALWLHCGDSRLYHFRDVRILTQTSDHSVPGLFVAAKEIGFDEIRQHPDRNKLLRALGGGGNESGATVLKQPVKIERNDRFLLCSDGFWEYVLENEMLACWDGDIAGWLQNMEALIVKRAKYEHDNYTACAIQVS